MPQTVWSYPGTIGSLSLLEVVVLAEFQQPEICCWFCGFPAGTCEEAYVLIFF